MNFDSTNSGPRPYPRPRQNLPAQPAQQGEEGMDPAALIAARTAAVARNRQKSERASLIHDMLRIIGVLVLIGGVAWVVHVKHRHRVEEARLQAAHEAEAQAARAKEHAEADARAEARRAADRAVEAEIRRKEEERRQEAARRADVQRQRAANMKRYDSALKRFHRTTLELLSSAPVTDLPAKVASETWYSCVVPGGRMGLTVYEVQALPGKDIHVMRLDETGEVTNVSLDEFNCLVAASPYLLAKGAHCYYKGEKNWGMRVPVPLANERLDPSREDLRDLYAFVSRQCNKQAALSYEVFFRDVGGAETRILLVPFGVAFGRKEVVEGLQRFSVRRVGASEIQARVNEGCLVIRRKGGAL